MNKDTLLNNIKPLDLLFFKTRGIFSNIIHTGQNMVLGYSNVNHVGIIINKKVMPTLKTKDYNKLFIMESTYPFKNEPKDIERNALLNGVQIRDLSFIINFHLKNNHSIFWAKLNNNPFVKLSTDNNYDYSERLFNIQNVFDAIHFKHFNTSYQFNIFNLFSPIISFCLPIREIFGNDNNRFCSQLVIEIYKDLDIVDVSDCGIYSPQHLLIFPSLFLPLVKI